MNDVNELTSFLTSLRSVRRFSTREIPEQVLGNVLEVARWTGSAKNTQPWHVIVIRERATLLELSKCGPYAGHIAGAQLALALVMENANQRFDEGRLAQNVMLGAWAHGVGSCIGSMYPEPNTKRAKAVLSVPEARYLHTVISLGYPADERALRLSTDRRGLSDVPIGRRDLASLVSRERWSVAWTEA